MRVELRHGVPPQGGLSQSRGLVLIAVSDEESKALDAIFGKSVGEDGLISTRTAECRLSDGYAEHYIYVKAEQ